MSALSDSGISRLTSYKTACDAYFNWYGLFFAPFDSHENAHLIERMEDRIEGFNSASEALTRATAACLKSPVLIHDRPAAVMALLLQMEGDLMLADYSWQVIHHPEESDADDNPLLSAMTDTHQLSRTYRRLQAEMPRDLETYTDTYTVPVPPVMAETASEQLTVEIQDTLELIRTQTLSLGLRMTRQLDKRVKNDRQPQIEELINSIDLLRGTEKTGSIAWGLEDNLRTDMPGMSGLVAELRGILVNLVEKLLMLVEHNNLVRYTVADWLEELLNLPHHKRKNQLTRLLDGLYRTTPFIQHDLPRWLQDATHPAGIQRAMSEIHRSNSSFRRLTAQVHRTADIIDAFPLMFSHPLLRSTGFALQTGLFGLLVFAGYDHLDEGSRGLNLARGIKEILINELPVSLTTREMTAHMRDGLVRTP